MRQIFSSASDMNGTADFTLRNSSSPEHSCGGMGQEEWYEIHLYIIEMYIFIYI